MISNISQDKIKEGLNIIQIPVEQGLGCKEVAEYLKNTKEMLINKGIDNFVLVPINSLKKQWLFNHISNKRQLKRLRRGG